MIKDETVTVTMPLPAAIAAAQLLCDIRLEYIKLDLSNEKLKRLCDAEIAMVNAISGRNKLRRDVSE